ncbi:MAG: helix-turn-helix domain-containing protein [Chthoniobacterales bacterium]|nr:helix-turn-helix domain-containing protein [Chthoniobacterales bacterium]
MKSSTDDLILQELGHKITSLRLQKNWTQRDLSVQAGVSKSTLERLERGSSIQLAGFMRILRSLELLEAFRSLFPAETISPMTQVQLQRQQRQRASRSKAKIPQPWNWKE